jgi:hypothetical protein
MIVLTDPDFSLRSSPSASPVTKRIRCVAGKLGSDQREAINQPKLTVASFVTSAALVLVPAFEELDTAPHGSDITAEFMLAPVVFGDAQLF